MRTSFQSGALALLLALPLISGCYKYVPAEIEAVPPGTDLRLFLSRAAILDLPEEIPTPNGNTLEGALVARESGRVFVNVPVAERTSGIHTVAMGQSVPVSVADILQTEQKQVDGTKTALALASTTAAGVALLAFIIQAFGGDDSNDQNPPPDESIRIPLGSIRIR